MLTFKFAKVPDQCYLNQRTLKGDDLETAHKDVIDFVMTRLPANAYAVDVDVTVNVHVYDNKVERW